MKKNKIYNELDKIVQYHNEKQTENLLKSISNIKEFMNDTGKKQLKEKIEKEEFSLPVHLKNCQSYFGVKSEDLIPILKSANNITKKFKEYSLESNIILHIEKGELRIRCTNNEIFLDTSLKVEEFKGDVDIALNCKLLYETTKKAKGYLYFGVDKGHKVNIIVNGTETILIGIETSDFPSSPEIDIDKKVEFDIPYDILKDIYSIQYCTKKVKNGIYEQGKEGILFEYSENGLVCVATDGCHLLKKNYKDIKFESKGEIVMPVGILKEALTMKNKVKIILDDKLVKIGHFVSNHLGVNFPPYTQVIPKKSKESFTVSKKDLQEAINKISPMLKIEKKYKVIFNLTGNELTVKGISNNGETSEVIDVTKNNCTDLDMAFNYKYLLDFLKNTDEEEIIIETQDTYPSPVVMNRSDKGLYIIMPIKI